MSLMSYCTDADECDLIYPSKNNSSQENNTMDAKDPQDKIEATKRTNKKSKSNCSNIRAILQTVTKRVFLLPRNHALV